jgi:hypothetical protein
LKISLKKKPISVSTTSHHQQVNMSIACKQEGTYGVAMAVTVCMASAAAAAWYHQKIYKKQAGAAPSIEEEGTIIEEETEESSE